MSKLRSFKRHLNPSKVWLAQQVAEEKIKIARQVVLERAQKDAAFAADVLKAVGDALPKEIKEACEESVRNQSVMVVENPEAKVVAEAVVHLDDGMVVVQSDGGGPLIVHETQLPDYPTDGPNSAIDFPEKLVQEEGPKAEKA
ncbi:MAG: hypothetical protein NTY03_05015 [Candidatus Bathyarchaeota archaeon]|nr:hypothetical protein [Candidatus Bathyarchaeota archaeon]